MRPLLFSVTLFTGLFAAVAAFAAEVEERIEEGSLSFNGGRGFSNAVLLITGPGDFEREETAGQGLPVFRAKNSGSLADGLYQYALTAATDEKVKIKKKVDNGRGASARDHILKPFAMHGTFVVKNGTIVAAQEVKDGVDGDPEETKAATDTK